MSFDQVYSQWMGEQGLVNPDDATDEQLQALVDKLHGANLDTLGNPALYNWADDDSEDWIKAGSWDFHYNDGRPIDTLTDLATLLNRDPKQLAGDLLTLPFGRAAPLKIRLEAMVEYAR